MCQSYVQRTPCPYAGSVYDCVCVRVCVCACVCITLTLHSIASSVSKDRQRHEEICRVWTTLSLSLSLSLSDMNMCAKRSKGDKRHAYLEAHDRLARFCKNVKQLMNLLLSPSVEAGLFADVLYPRSLIHKLENVFRYETVTEDHICACEN